MAYKNLAKPVGLMTQYNNIRVGRRTNNPVKEKLEWDIPMKAALSCSGWYH